MDKGRTAAQYIPDQGNYASLFGQRYASTEEDEIPLAYHHQWQPGTAGNLSQTQSYLEPSYFPSALGPVPNSDPSSQVAGYQSAPFGHGTLLSGPSHDSSTETPAHNTSDSWKGENKQELLETLLETIGSCDESRVAQVIQVVRMSATPEETVSGICQVLGIADKR